MSDKQPNILVVDDEPEIADLVGVYLQSEGFSVAKCHSGKEALDAAREQEFDLAVLDVMLPDISGFTLCAQLREGHAFPILMLTAKAGDMDKINGLTIGADDYMTKPFNPLELAARVKAQLRRYTRYNGAAAPADADEVDVAGLVMNRATHRCWLFEEEIPLTPIEFDILWTLCRHKGQVISAEQLFEQVWGEKYLERNNTVMVHIRRIREKLGDTDRGDDRIIKTVWGVGYRIG